MTPANNPQSSAGSSPWVTDASPGEEICITGISGAFPDSNSISHLAENLFNKVDLITDDERRWKKTHPEIPQRTGKINHIDKFDASFFGFDFKQAHSMDPQSRVLLEKVYEAIIDAGYNPSELRNTRTGVYVGVCLSESEVTWFYDKMEINDYCVPGCSRSMMASRLSQWLGVTGPSYSVDSACSSSLYAMEHAVAAIRNGCCDAAIVGGTNVLLHPCTSLQFARLGVLSPDGSCKSFDNRANGYVRSEAIAACFLQKAKDSRRIYAQLVHAKSNCDGYKEKGITYPAGNVQKMLLQEFYAECGVPPCSLEYVEAHGTGTQVGDPEELNAIDDIFCTGRSGQLLIGTVKSNLGHAESSSGLCSIAKICIAYNTGYIPPNINFTHPRQGIEGLDEGRLKVVTEKMPWNRGLVGISSFGFGGANAHVLLKNIARNKVNNGKPTDDLPRLVCVSGRTESAVAKIFDGLESRTVDVDEIRLWHSVHERDIPGHFYRGHILLRSEPDKSVRLTRHIQLINNKKRPIWFVYTNLGKHWATIAQQLMALPLFACSIKRCHDVLEHNDFNLIKLITDADFRKSYNDHYSLIGEVAVHIALTDVLEAIGIKPDFVISHGIAELACAYADKCLNAEQTITAAYSIVLASENKSKSFLTISVKTSFEKIKSICPPEIEVSYHTSVDSCSVTGVAQVVQSFISELSIKGIPVEDTAMASTFAYHSGHAVEIASKLTQNLEIVIPSPKTRSDRWISTSVPKTYWNKTKAQLSSAEYHINSLIRPVLFEEASSTISSDAILVEIGLRKLAANLSRSLQKDASAVALVNNQDSLMSFLISLGKMYETGFNPLLCKIYPDVPFPVPQGTPMLSHLVEWDHSEHWYVASFKKTQKQFVYKTWEKTIKFSLCDEDCEYLVGHCIDGRVIYPATGYLILVWEMLAQLSGREYTELSVVFEDIYFLRATNIPKDGTVRFTIVIQRGSGNFEITENGTPVVVGRIYEKKDAALDFKAIPPGPESDSINPEQKLMFKKDFYKELTLRGYQYSGMFRGVLDCTVDGTRGHLTWDDNWVTFIDTMLQAKIVTHDTRSLYVPTRIEKLSIDVDAHYSITSNLNAKDNGTKSLAFRLYPVVEVTRCGGVEICGLHVTAISKKVPLGIPVLEKNEFVANITNEIIPDADSLRSKLQLILENIQTYTFKTIEVVDEEYKENGIRPIIESVGDILGDLPLIQAELVVISEESVKVPPTVTVQSAKKLQRESNVVLFIGANLSKRPKVLEEGASTLKCGGFILSRETSPLDYQVCSETYDIITVHKTEKEYLVLLKNKTPAKMTKYIKIITADQTYSWIEKVKKEMKDGQKIVLYNQYEAMNGLLGLVNCLRKEPGGEIVHGILIADSKAPAFEPNLELYKEQLDKDLAINVLKNGKWGTYRHLLLTDLSTVPAPHAYVNTATIGDLTSLRWWEGPINQDRISKIPQQQKLVHVYSSALNFRDVMTAMGRVTLDAVARGRLAQDCVQGIEVAGRAVNGSRVMAICEKGISNLIQTDETLMWPIPDEWNFEEAATVPVAYGTVYMALVMIGKIRRGESILIHAGSGGVGQAAISVALHYGLEVFTTVGTPSKRLFIKKLFPQLNDNHIGNSRDLSFQHMIRRETNGRGVDVVLNSLADDKLQASVKCLTNRGRFLEIGKYDITINTQLEMCFLKKEISFHGVMLDYISDDQSYRLRKELQQLIMNGIKIGAVRPLTYCIFEKHEIETAYRHMAAGKHIGKIIIRIRDEEAQLGLVKSSLTVIDAVPRYVCNEDEVYVLLGGLGGFGLELADWLVLRGARKILMSSRRGISNGYQSFRLKIWAAYGADVQISTHDVTSERGCKKMLKMAATMGPVKAIFNLAVVLKDAVFTNQTPDTFKISFAPKASATIHLDKLSRKLCPELKDFVIFSSVSCGRGNAGQTNYGFSNSMMERICEERKNQGLPALAIQWGAIGDVGLVADMQEENVQLEIGGTVQQRISSCLQALEKFLKHDAAIVSSMVVAEKRAAGAGTVSIVDAVAQIIGIPDLKTVSQQVPLSELGMDSIMAVEIKQTLERKFEIFLAAQEIRTLTFARLLELTAQNETTGKGGATPAAAAAAAGVQGTDVFQMLIKSLGDEEMAAKSFVDMPTAGSSKDEEKFTTETLFMLPGLESCATTLQALCSKLTTKACVMQLGFKDTNEDLTQMVQKIYETVKSRLSPGAPFYLLGYSFGTLPILHLAAKLESEGHKGIVFCVDGSPLFFSTVVNRVLSCTDEFTMQNSMIIYCINAFLKTNIGEQVMLKFLRTQSFEERIKIAIDMCSINMYSDKFMIDMCLATFNRVREGVNFANNLKILKSPIVLLRSKVTSSFIPDEYYGLDKLTEGVVTVHSFEGDHVSIIESDDCATTINKILIENRIGS